MVDVGDGCNDGSYGFPAKLVLARRGVRDQPVLSEIPTETPFSSVLAIRILE